MTDNTNTPEPITFTPSKGTVQQDEYLALIDDDEYSDMLAVALNWGR